MQHLIHILVTVKCKIQRWIVSPPSSLLAHIIPKKNRNDFYARQVAWVRSGAVLQNDSLWSVWNVRKWTKEDIYSILLTLIALLTSILTLKVSFWFWIMKKNWVFSDLGRFSLIPHLNWGLGMIQIIIQSSICIIGDKLIIDRLTTRSALVPSRWPRMIRIASRLPRWSHELNLLHR